MQLKMEQAGAQIAAAPSRFFRLTMRRGFLYWFGDADRPTRMFGLTFPMIFGLNWLKIVLNSMLVGLALAALAAPNSLPGRWVILFGLLLLPLSYYFTHVSPNYRVFVDVLSCPMAGVFLARIADRHFLRPGTGR